MLTRIWETLTRYRRIIARCGLLTGAALIVFQDLHDVVSDRIRSVISPERPKEETCVPDYFEAQTDRPKGSYLIIVTDMAYDPDRTQSVLIDRTLRRLYGDDLGGAIQMETIPCTIFSAAGNAAKRTEDAKQLALEIAERAGADVVLWGEVVARDELISLRMTHTQETSGTDYAVEDNKISINFGEDLGRLIAAKMLSLSTLTTEETGNFIIPRMNRVLTVTAPLLAAMPSQMRNEDKATVLNAHAVALYNVAVQSGDEPPLRKSIETLQEATNLLSRSTNPDAWAKYTHHLGIALATLGARRGSEHLLEQAISAYRAALSERNQAKAPQKWATTQNNLGIALSTLGQLNGRDDLLEQAITAYRSALTERTREKLPLHWAETQNNLGGALSVLGTRRGSEDLLKQAVFAYRTALTERTQNRVPLYWAGTQINLGGAFLALGELQGSEELLEQAVTAFRFAQNELLQDQVPVLWAKTQSSLGKVLQTLGEHRDSEKLLEESIIAYRAALTEQTRERVPREWASTQTGLGNVLQNLGTRRGSTELLDQSIAAFRAALSERNKDQEPIVWAATQYRIGLTLLAAGSISKERTVLQDSISTFSEALSKQPRDKFPNDWAIIKGHQAEAMRLLAQATSDPDLARQAIAQLIEAGAAARKGGMKEEATFFLSRIPLAQALIDRLTGP